MKVVSTPKSIWKKKGGIRPYLINCTLYKALTSNMHGVFLFSLIRFFLKLRTMIEHSRQWALARGLLEKSAVHGEEEWRIPLKRRFKNTEKTGNEVQERVTQQVQERSLVA